MYNEIRMIQENHCFTFVNTFFKIFVFSILGWFIYDGVHRFVQDEDVSLISFRTFHKEEDNLYPTTTLCFYNPFLKNQLEQYGQGINVTSYSHYLQGKILDDRMKYISYDNVTIKMEDYLLGMSGKLENGSYFWLYDADSETPLYHLARDPPYYTSFRSGLNKCFSFELPYIPRTVIWSLFITVKTNIFPNGDRFQKVTFDGSDPTKGGFKVSFHYPKQRFRSSFNMKYQWSKPTWKEEEKRKKLGYYMQFRIRGIEVLTHRHKRNDPCNEDWRNDDPNFTEQVLRNVGCTPPQLLNFSQLPICSTKEKLSECHEVLNYPTTLDLSKYDIPCREIEKLQYEYTEDYATTQNDDGENREYFQIRLYFADTTYKYIEQVKM